MIRLTSPWRHVEISVDGNDAEWPGGATLLVEAPIAVGVTNDAAFVYVRVRTSDRDAGMRMLFGGLTVWFDAGGGEKKAFGIKYPVGAPLPEPRRGGEPGGPDGAPPRGERPDDAGAQEGEPGSRPAPPMDPSKVVPPRAELYGPKKDDARSLVGMGGAGGDLFKPLKAWTPVRLASAQ